MPRQNITHLALPDRQYRVDLDPTSDFETLAAARNEDHLRAKMLLKYADSPISPSKRRRAIQLAEALKSECAHQTMASADYLRTFRIRAVGHLSRICATESVAPSTVTIWGRGMEVHKRDLPKVDPRARGKAFRADLNRAGAKGAEGYIAAFLDAEYNPGTEVYKFHFHCQADGELKAVFDRLRKTRKYGRPKDIRISRKPLTNLPKPLTYLIKPFWGSRWEGCVDGEKRRQAYRSRIKEPEHSELMLWLDRWSPNDASVLVGLEVINGQLVKTKKYSNGDLDWY
jgi:hypothetical protein